MLEHFHICFPIPPVETFGWQCQLRKDDAISLDFAFGPGAQNEDIFCLVADLPQKALEGWLEEHMPGW